MEPLPPDHGHNPKVLRSWARRTGYKSYVSGEGYSSSSDADVNNPDAANTRLHSSIEFTRLKNPPGAGSEVSMAKESTSQKPADFVAIPPPPPPPPSVAVSIDKKAPSAHQPVNSQHINGGTRKIQRITELEAVPSSQDAEDVLLAKQSHMKFEIRENPGFVTSTLYGSQHYLSMAGSIVLIPLVIVPAMGGTDEDTARVVSTVLMVTGLTSLLHTFFGSRLPLIQGASFVYLAPALAIINSTEFQRIGTDRFKRTMRELQGAVIIASIFQTFLGYSGLMSFVLRFINPVVVTPTVAAVGLAFYTYGFPVIGSCVEIGIPQMLVVLIFALYLRRVSIYGRRFFQIFAIPLGLAIVWAYAFLLTAGGAYNYSGCNPHVPVSNIVSKACKKHAFTMLHCRTDMSTALKTAAWVWFPYPFQWGIPTFQWKTASIMMVANVIGCVDSVGSYHASSLLVAARAPTPGIVSRAIGLEGLTSILAGLWGIGTGASTLTENVHTIAVTKMGSRRVIQVGACTLVIMSLFGKIGALIASIPSVIVAALLLVMWTMITAFGLSNLRYSETGSSRNVIIVGLSLFLSLSVPVYFQQYALGSRVTTVPSYFLPYTVAAHGPIRTGFQGLDFFLNTMLSMSMAIAFLVAFFLDNTVAGSRQERGTYIWSKPATIRNDVAAAKDYCLPPRLARFFSWAKWVGS
ncbi:hypothetical protein GOP47_0025899 [Adiantum capillus-veneris]|uniref:Nucleobase-ascorbate transporter 12 n=1 Tax=Adiantum capillus-veneris TaxID=13818 RepID=A0A9D4U269_ADICA|nr:hypothetical protein GOP47_0025899 [Adiantum capillus-veneris]